ncbi:MAG: CpsD/CapB family tyrosine-protein kinase [Clostridia bacterium]|nr:CpsD/CapB family tyrosine-protein kinase [Clostridia bacterium]
MSCKIIDKATSFGILEAYKTARTNLMFTLSAEKGCKKILVTSPLPREGKSTTVINLAITFAQTGARVIVLDADLRRPKIHQYLNVSNKDGLAQYLGGFKTDCHDVIQHVSAHNIDCITGGPIPPNPSELLISGAMQELLDQLSLEYDYIFVDSPPVNSVTDSVSVAKNMSGAVLVARQNFTTRESLQQAITALEFGEIKILGYMFNGVELASQTLYKKSYYQSEYRM